MVRAGLILLLFIVGAAEVMGRSRAVRGLERDTHAMIDDVRKQLAAGEPVIFKRRVEMYPLRGRRRTCWRKRHCWTSLHRAIQTCAGSPSTSATWPARSPGLTTGTQLAPLDELPRRFVLVVPPDPREQEDTRAMFPQAQLQQRGTWIWLIAPK
jgi:hypothetical protein